MVITYVRTVFEIHNPFSSNFLPHERAIFLLFLPRANSLTYGRIFLIVGSLCLGGLLVIPSSDTVAAFNGSQTNIVHNNLSHNHATVSQAHPLFKIPPTGKGLRSAPANIASTPPPVNWDEQLGLTISQDQGSLAYNVTAVEQTDSDGYGPAYLLNGLTDKGEWYQVGLAYDWPVDSGGYFSGFSFLYEVFNSTGGSVYPTNGGGGLLNYSGQINQGDEVLLSLNFTNNRVIMSSKDWNTGATSWANYSSFGGAIFVGLQTSNNPIGFFSGLMTEQYHALPYTGTEAAVTYSNVNVGLNAATMWIDEYNVNTNQSLFGASSADIAYSNPNQFQTFSVNGTSEQSDAYEFVTGSNVLVGMTMSYNIIGGSSGSLAPKLRYLTNGNPQSTILTTTPKLYLLDQGSFWSITNPLNGSSSSQVWLTSQPNGTIVVPETMVISYTHKYQVSFGVSPNGSGTVLPSTSGWFVSGTTLNLTASPKSPYLFSSWVANSTGIVFGNFTSSSTTAIIGGSGRITGKFSVLTLSLASYSESLTEGTSVSNLAKIVGNNESVSLSITGLPGATIALWKNNVLTAQLNPTTDSFNISTSFSTPPGKYNVTILATAPNGSDSIQFSLTVKLADPFSVSFSTSDNISPSSPRINYVYNGIQKEATLGSSPQIIYLDNGSTWQISSALNSSSTQRWITTSPTQGEATGATSINVTYFHQYFVGFSFGSENNSSGSGLTISPKVNYTSGGITTSVTANGTKVWADSGTSFSYPTVLTVSSVDRWLISGSSSGVVSGAMTSNAIYQEQFLVNASYKLLQPGSTSSPPKLNVVGNGSASQIILTQAGTSYWFVSGLKWSASGNISGNGLERWLGSNLSGTVSSPRVITPVYSAQYYVTIGENSPLAGSVSAKNGWFNANTSIPVTALANQGWRFEMWNGNAGSINQSTTSFIVNSPVNETAVFYSSLAITSAANGHVDYSFGSNSGSVSGGSTTTVYVPPDTNVSLKASSDSSFYSPGQWSVGNGSSSSSASSFFLSVSSPMNVAASFELDLTLIALVGAVIVGVLGAVVFLFLRKSGGRDFSSGASHSWKW